MRSKKGWVTYPTHPAAVLFSSTDRIRRVCPGMSPLYVGLERIIIFRQRGLSRLGVRFFGLGLAKHRVVLIEHAPIDVNAIDTAVMREGNEVATASAGLAPALDGHAHRVMGGWSPFGPRGR